jgi:hypothetical protein
MGDITSANAVLALTIPPLFVIPQQLQGFATDDVYNVPAIESVEVLMGVDGVLSAGFVYKQVEQEIMLQADSISNAIFDTWWLQMQATLITYPAAGVISLPNIATKFIQVNGFLTSYSPAPQAKRLLQPRRFRITWNQISPVPG